MPAKHERRALISEQILKMPINKVKNGILFHFIRLFRGINFLPRSYCFQSVKKIQFNFFLILNIFTTNRGKTK